MRLLVGLLMLKYYFNLSDDKMVAQWKENVCWQAFTGEILFSIDAPCDSSELSRFRCRIGKEGSEFILSE
ncbi:MAG: transposase, partial [Deltaproteobacteria bacterium]|nr:transposase [Deltaproteobacteria bacterium]